MNGERDREAPEHTIAAAAPAIEAAPASTQQRLLALQQKVGNAAFARMVHRWKGDKPVLARQDIPTEAEIAEAQAWADEGVREGKDITPGVGGAGFNDAPGGFDASSCRRRSSARRGSRCSAGLLATPARPRSLTA